MRLTWRLLFATALICPVAAQAADLSLHNGSADFTASAAPALANGAGVQANAALNLNLPGLTTQVEGGAQSTRRDTALAGNDAQDSAHLRVKTSLSHGHAQVSLTAEDKLDVHAHDGATGDALYSAHTVQQNDTRSAGVEVSIAPLPDVTLTAGSQQSETATQQSQWFSGGSSESRVASTVTRDQASATYKPLPNAEITAKTAFTTADLRMQSGTAAEARWQAVEPDITATVRPFGVATISAGVGREVTPITPGNLAAWRAASGVNAGADLQPDSATDLHTSASAKAGPLTLSADYTAAALDSTTVLGDGPNGQIPQSISGGQQQVAKANVSMTLAPLGLDNTDLSSQGTWRNSRIHDPVTGQDHALSGEVPHEAQVTLSQALPGSHVNFGVSASIGATSTFYQVAQETQVRTDPSLGAFLHYAPGPFALDLKVDGLGGGGERTDLYYAGTRDGGLQRTVQSAVGGPSVGITFSKALGG